MTVPGPLIGWPSNRAPSSSPNSGQDSNAVSADVRRDEPLAVVATNASSSAFCASSSGTSRCPMKKIASTLLRFGPPLAGCAVVFSGVFEMMLESVRMYVS